MYCTAECPLGSFYQVDGSERTCVARCYPNYYANLSGYCGSAADCPSENVTYYGDDSTGRCVESKCWVM